MFRRILAAERLKMSKGRMWLLVLASPLLSLAVGLLMDESEVGLTWAMAAGGMSMVHAMLLLPILSGLFAALLCRYEHTDGGWKQLLSLPVTRTAVYVSKFLMIAFLLACTQLLMLAVIVVIGLTKGVEGAIPWTMLLQCVLGGWVACLPLAALQLAVSQAWSSFAAPLALNVSFTLPNMLIANSATYGPYYPWTQPMLAMIPRGEQDFGAFNLPLESLLIVVLGSFVLFFGAGFLSFKRKAV
ncbi:ABC transporter permease [Paenibacillus sp. CN-4]|uniref:ABC transporter permease n=1 Tax=Paenibacillus nanchangensis TaxID=3348343 RepID=UPI00397B9D0D